eukprot:3068535-Rhodomonas_salina.2
MSGVACFSDVFLRTFFSFVRTCSKVTCVSAVWRLFRWRRFEGAASIWRARSASCRWARRNQLRKARSAAHFVLGARLRAFDLAARLLTCQGCCKLTTASVSVSAVIPDGIAPALDCARIDSISAKMKT